MAVCCRTVRAWYRTPTRWTRQRAPDLSIGGKGNSKGPLDEVGSQLSAQDIHAWITDSKGMTAKTKATRKPEMKAFTLPKEDVDALVAYLSAMKKK